MRVSAVSRGGQSRLRRIEAVLQNGRLIARAMAHFDKQNVPIYHSSVMSVARFRQRIDPGQLAGREARLEGELPVASLPRIARLVTDGGSSQVRAQMEFWRDNSGVIVIDGRVEGSVVLQCQRCLEPVSWPVSGDFRLAMHDGERGGSVPEGYELLEPLDEGIVPAELVEEELLLALPLVASHAELADCGPLAAQVGEPGSAEEMAASSASPFAALAKMNLE